MDLGAIDRWARQDSPMHRATPRGKLAGALLSIAGVTLSDHPVVAGAIGLGWLLVMGSSRVPLGKAALLAAYAMGFAALYAFLSWEGNWLEAALLILKAAATAASVLAVVVTTPYPEIFQALRRWMPSLLADALLLTYRSLFILLHRWDHLWAALHLRRGIHRRHPLRTAQTVAPALGVLFLGALDRSENLYDAMRLRGYRGRIAAPSAPAPRAQDLLPLALGLLSLAVALGTRGS